MTRLIELLRDAFTSCPLSRSQAWREIRRRAASLAEGEQMCDGCEENFYNGNNSIGVGECWHFKSAVVCNKVGYSSIHVPNGPDTKITGTLKCWHAVSK